MKPCARVDFFMRPKKYDKCTVFWVWLRRLCGYVQPRTMLHQTHTDCSDEPKIEQRLIEYAALARHLLLLEAENCTQKL